MRYVDIAIVGGGLAGATTAAMLGRAGIATVLVDPHTVYPPDLRCEKLGGSQIDLLNKTGLGTETLRATTLDGEVWEARFGHVVDKRPSDQQGVMYDTLVNTMRAQIPDGVDVLHAKATAIATSRERQTLRLSDGNAISARLVVLANGLNISLRHALGIERRVISECHSITIGFDVAPIGRAAFDFPALTYWPHRPADRMAYLTLFPIDSAMRANLMVYRPLDDPWLRQFRRAPEETMRALMPNLQDLLGDFKVVGQVRIRPADLYVTEGHRQAGIVLVGDAFATSCPAAGTGTTKVFTDVERLCNVHIPRWLATEGMDVEKIAAFYDDPVKIACDAMSRRKAYELRSLTLDEGLSWRAQRWALFLLRCGQGMIRAVGRRINAPEPAAAPVSRPLHFDGARTEV